MAYITTDVFQPGTPVWIRNDGDFETVHRIPAIILQRGLNIATIVRVVHNDYTPLVAGNYEVWNVFVNQLELR